MATPQEIREKVFEKAVFNGYDMASVDDFMDTVATEIGLLQKENAALKAKMKVLVDKIEEYRNNESALNMAMLSAQKLSVQIESDARSRATAIVNEADAQAAATIGSIDERVAQEEARLQAAKISTAKFLDSALSMCRQQLDRLEAINAASRNELRAEVKAEEVYKPEEAFKVEEVFKEEERIPEEIFDIDRIVAEPDPLEAGNTQVFSFSKDV